MTGVRFGRPGIAVLQDSRTHIEAQDHKIARLEGTAKPLLAEARPAVPQAEPLILRVRRLLSPAGRSLESITTAADEVPRLAAGADLVLSEAIPLLQALNATDAPARSPQPAAFRRRSRQATGSCAPRMPRMPRSPSSSAHA